MTVVPDVTIDRVAIALLAADHPEACGWSGKPEATKDYYRRLARAALAAAEPDDGEGFVGVTCDGADCHEGGYYSAGGWTPVDDDGHPFVYDDGWYCARCASAP